MFKVLLTITLFIIFSPFNSTETGSALLSQLGLVTSTLPWLGFLRFAGMACHHAGPDGHHPHPSDPGEVAGQVCPGPFGW